MKRASSQLTDRARQLRKAGTLSERRMWSWVRNRTFAGYKFRRQFPLDRYVLDFYCPQLKLAIEIDGMQHEDASVSACDTARTERLRELGVTIVRIPNVLLARDSVLVDQQIRYWIKRQAEKK